MRMVDVITCAFVPNPNGVPPDCVAYVVGVSDTAPLTPNAVRMTWAEYSAYQVLHQPAYDAWEASFNAAQQAAKDATEPDLAALRDQAQTALDGNNAYLALTLPTNAQVAAQVKLLTQENNKVIKALLRYCLKQLS